MGQTRSSGTLRDIAAYPSEADLEERLAKPKPLRSHLRSTRGSDHGSGQTVIASSLFFPGPRGPLFFRNGIPGRPKPLNVLVHEISQIAAEGRQRRRGSQLVALPPSGNSPLARGSGRAS
jgi:hypothetical protein